MRGVKVWMAAAALLWLLVTPAQASVIPDSVTEALPPEAAAHLEGLDETPDHTTWSEGLARLWRDTQQQLGEALREKASGAALLLGVVLLCGVAESFFTAAEQPSVPRFVPMAGALAIDTHCCGGPAADDGTGGGDHGGAGRVCQGTAAHTVGGCGRQRRSHHSGDTTGGYGVFCQPAAQR